MEITTIDSRGKKMHSVEHINPPVRAASLKKGPFVYRRSTGGGLLRDNISYAHARVFGQHASMSIELDHHGYVYPMVMLIDDLRVRCIIPQKRFLYMRGDAVGVRNCGDRPRCVELASNGHLMLHDSSSTETCHITGLQQIQNVLCAGQTGPSQLLCASVIHSPDHHNIMIPTSVSIIDLGSGQTVCSLPPHLGLTFAGNYIKHMAWDSNMFTAAALFDCGGNAKVASIDARAPATAWNFISANFVNSSDWMIQEYTRDEQLIVYKKCNHTCFKIFDMRTHRELQCVNGSNIMYLPTHDRPLCRTLMRTRNDRSVHVFATEIHAHMRPSGSDVSPPIVIYEYLYPCETPETNLRRELTESRHIRTIRVT
jgi:hypothetical protein